MSPTPPPEKFGRYEIIEHLATGGMAEIYKARTIHSQALIIKKVLPAYNKNEDFIQMFLEEAKISLGLKHPQIIRVLDFGQLDGSYYLAMEYVFGKDLGSLLKRSLEKRVYLPIEVACQIVVQCARALDYAHHLSDYMGNSVSVIHRDVSPPNILVSFNGEAKILDFGIAKAVNTLQGSQTRSGVLKGKFCYMSPEQARGEPLNHQSDLFSLGIVLHELLTTKSLFYAGDEIQTLERVRNAKVEAPSKGRKEIPRELDQIVLKALQPKLSKRYNSCREFADALQGFLKKHYPRADQRNVAKIVRHLFQEEFHRRSADERQNGWKDIFVSGAADDGLLLDRDFTIDSDTLSKARTAPIRISWWARLLYDPKVNLKFIRNLRYGSLGAALLAAGIIFYQSESYREFKTYLSEQQNPLPQNLEPRTPPSTAQQLPDEGSFAFYIQQADRYEQRGDIPNTIRSLRKALHINRFDQSLRLRYEFLRVGTADWKEACDWLLTNQELLASDRLFAQALCAEKQGQAQRALGYYNDYLQRFPRDSRNSQIQLSIKELGDEGELQ